MVWGWRGLASSAPCHPSGITSCLYDRRHRQAERAFLCDTLESLVLNVEGVEGSAHLMFAQILELRLTQGSEGLG